MLGITNLHTTFIRGLLCSSVHVRIRVKNIGFKCTEFFFCFILRFIAFIKSCFIYFTWSRQKCVMQNKSIIKSCFVYFTWSIQNCIIGAYNSELNEFVRINGRVANCWNKSVLTFLDIGFMQ